MAFCFECGDRLDDDLSSCSSCGWDKKQLEEEKYYPDRRCLECERAGKSPSVCCGICKEVWFCRWCHGNRIKRIREIFSKRDGIEVKVETDNPYDDGIRGPVITHSKEMIIEFNKYEPCLRCSRKLIEKLVQPTLDSIYLDGNKKYKFYDSRYDLEHKEKTQGEIYSSRSKIRMEKILNSFGFNKELFLLNPLDD